LRFNVSTMGQYKRNPGLRQLIIFGMTRQKQINFILRKDNSFTADSFASQTDKEVRDVALSVDKNFLATSQKQWTSINKLIRQNCIDAIIRNDNSYSETNFSGQSDEQLYELALRTNKNIQENKHKKKK